MGSFRPAVGPSEAAAFLAERYGPSASAPEPIAPGEMTRVFGFALEGAPMVVRFGDDESSFRRERFVGGAFAAPDRPIPRVREIGRWRGTAFAVAERLPGVGMLSLPAAELPALVPSMVETAVAVARADVSAWRGFGVFGAEGHAGEASWRAHLAAIWDEPAAGFWAGWHGLFDTSCLERDVAERVYGRMCELLPRCPERRCLVHADYGPHNLLAAGGRVSGVVDWANARYGDFVFDTAQVENFWPELGFAAAARPAYEAAGLDVAHYDERVACYRLYQGLDALRFYAKGGRPADYAATRTRLLGMMAGGR